MSCNFPRVAFMSSPTLFQSQGGLQIQIRETIEALRLQGVDAVYIDPAVQSVAAFDLVHVFGSMNGQHRIVEFAKRSKIPTVISPLIQPHWRETALTARLMDYMLRRFTKWQVKSDYSHGYMALNMADAIIALGAGEQSIIQSAFRIPGSKIFVVPNGIPERFFSATQDAAVKHDVRAKGCVLNVASINPHKNQLGLAEAVSTTGLHCVIVGGVLEAEKSYLDSVIAYSNVHYWGRLNYDDQLLSSIYAAAGVFCLPSLSEVMPLSVLESLAAGTPVVCTKHHGMDLSMMRDVVIEVDPHNKGELNAAIRHFIADPPEPEHCRGVVRHLSWKEVAIKVKEIYADVLSKSLQ